MIPKTIHYCWFGRNPLPKLAVKCIESWKKYLPDYEIKEWNEDNFNIQIIPYVKEAYEAKKYAFVSDYARFWILYNYGGVYFDTDVEVIKPMENILSKGAFMGCESGLRSIASGWRLACNPGLGLACIAGLGIYKEILDFYSRQHFRNEDGSLNQHTVVGYVTDILRQHGLKDIKEIQKVADVTIYPEDYFCPMSTITRKITITGNTYTIHHYSASWMDNKKEEALKGFVKRMLNENVILSYIRLKQHLISLLKRLC